MQMHGAKAGTENRAHKKFRGNIRVCKVCMCKNFLSCCVWNLSSLFATVDTIVFTLWSNNTTHAIDHLVACLCILLFAWNLSPLFATVTKIKFSS